MLKKTEKEIAGVISLSNSCAIKLAHFCLSPNRTDSLSIKLIHYIFPKLASF